MNIKLSTDGFMRAGKCLSAMLYKGIVLLASRPRCAPASWIAESENTARRAAQRNAADPLCDEQSRP